MLSTLYGKILSFVWSDCRRSLDWWGNLLNFSIDTSCRPLSHTHTHSSVKLEIPWQNTVWDQWPIFVFFLIIFRHFRGFWFGALSLTIGFVCRLQLLLVLARAVFLESESQRKSRPDFIVSWLRLLQHERPCSLIYFHHKQGSPAIPRG
jgi:hypothetical protein